MFAIERQNKIKEILFKEKRVDVSQLSEMFDVTEVTIRRDLDKLEQEGFLIKIYGGAVLNEDILQKNVLEEAESETPEDKKMIGSIAAQMIENGEAVFLGYGTTCLEIAKKIKDKKITVVTNDLAIALELKDSLGVKVIVTGGDLVPSTSMLVGRFAHQALYGIYINKAFIGVKGVNFDSGYTLDRYEEAMFIQEVAKISKEIIIVADHTKFYKTAFAKLGDLTMAKKIITNKEIPSEFKSFFFEHAVKLYTTYEFE
ncbi:MAG: DeoR/GlpR family DNA-binding transcription regulator [Tepidanaerobacteraceae bacterium]|jgi:DeoR/GlpR family transcriptional regulator of sugar metabolism|nr:DeoR/GlpR family DNA-binding transcription regulator [Tepidanaerobacteraceae bacterium]